MSGYKVTAPAITEASYAAGLFPDSGVIGFSAIGDFVIGGIGPLVDAELGKIATEYREAEKLIGYMTAVLGEVEAAALAILAIPEAFDLDIAVGEQLTFIGKRMGFPRCHCACVSPPLYGFETDGSGNTANPLFTLRGPCESATWLKCGEVGDGSICIDDDTAYRGHLRARRYQMMGLFDIQSLGAAIRHIWGDAAWIPRSGNGEVTLAPGRALTADETARLPVTLRVLSIAPGMTISVWLPTDPVLGFGAGWVGACSAGQMLCPIVIDPYACAA